MKVSHKNVVNFMQQRLDSQLKKAFIKNDIEKAKELIKQGANLIYKEDLLSYLAAPYHSEILKLVLNNHFKDDTGVAINNILHMAFHNGSMEIFKVCIRAGADINSFDNNGKTLLHYACNSATTNLATINFFIENGVDINTPCNSKALSTYCTNFINYDKNPLLHVVCKHGRYYKLLKILVHYENREQKNNEGQTPLHIAVENDNAKAVKILIGNGSDINVCDKKGQTPFYYATENQINNPDKIEILQCFVERFNKIISESPSIMDYNPEMLGLFYTAKKIIMNVVKQEEEKKESVSPKNILISSGHESLSVNYTTTNENLGTNTILNVGSKPILDSVRKKTDHHRRSFSVISRLTPRHKKEDSIIDKSKTVEKIIKERESTNSESKSEEKTGRVK